MVRIIVGNLMYVACGKKSIEDIENLFVARNREDGGITAPACGLYLKEVFY
ncbi:MAG: tRNA pseudouridine(38-40) synthase TruA, partial [Anaerofustis stercorihominis]|nr:tRNA pseudouridine(38-40) synthase TruA [Anaerofustis stercorihominis]